MNIHKEKRNTIHYWKTQHALKEYFREHFNLSPSDIDTEIEAARKDFKIRKHATIDMKDLWQKTGMSLLKKHSETKAFYCTVPTHCPYMNKDNGLCTWDKDCPFRSTINL